MATPFSWSDTVHIAFSSCLPCLSKTSNPGASESTDSLLDNPTAHRIPRARADELQGLLADSDAEAEQMSLHSNPGRSRKRTKRKKGKRMTLFGYDLFGHRPPPIYLPESDDEGPSRSMGAPTPTTRSSSLTFDSDAAPLDPSTIATISTSAAALRAREAAEEEERRAKAERREKRRQRKELKRVAKALALAEQGQDFEGFPGSGNGFPPEEYGPFVHVRNDDDEGDADADLDGGVYARKGTSGTGSGSDSRSRTSASRSQQSQGDLTYFSGPRVHRHRQPAERQYSAPSTSDADFSIPREKKAKSKSSTTTRSTASRASRSNTSSGSTSQSPSLASPVSPTFVGADSFPKSKLSIADDDFDGSQGLSEADLPSSGIHGAFPSPGLRGEFPSPGLGGFPSSGFGGPPKIQRRDSILARGGAFLATRGGTEDIDG
ncbi:hypothetical protein D9615_006223 [Tricholomella constricta]|uniref:Uncharacterized protein n=1 Tax=Tricholomella constricta TaxID=117010 RepID=A0A8H5HBD9_9AGAR|nr:hypothetical protein D9615_006223 [Tricholomella constricta]